MAKLAMPDTAPRVLALVGQFSSSCKRGRSEVILLPLWVAQVQQVQTTQLVLALVEVTQRRVAPVLIPQVVPVVTVALRLPKE